MPRKKKPGPKRPVGRPPVVIDIDQLKRLAAIGCTKEEASVVLGIGRRTLHDRIKADPKLGDIWEDGKLTGKVSLRRLQWRHANGNGGSAVNMTIHLSKHHLGETDKAAFELSGPGGAPIQVTLSKDDTGLL